MKTLLTEMLAAAAVLAASCVWWAALTVIGAAIRF